MVFIFMAAIVAQADNNGIFPGDRENILSQYPTHIRDYIAFVMDDPPLETIKINHLAVFFVS
jgi:hypothetical protein